MSVKGSLIFTSCANIWRTQRFALPQQLFNSTKMNWHCIAKEGIACFVATLEVNRLSYRVFCILYHDDVIKWKHFPRYWPFVRRNNRSPLNSPHKGQWRRALIFSLICAWINDWVNNRDAGDLRRHRVLIIETLNHIHAGLKIAKSFDVVFNHIISICLCDIQSAYLTIG